MPYSKSNRLKSHPMSGTKTVAATTNVPGSIVATWAATDDIWVVGAEILLEVGYVAVGQKADGESIVSAELTRSGLGFQDSTFLRCAHGVVEEDTAGAHPRHDGLYRREVVMFPENVGIMVDEGEAINVYAAFSNTGAVARIFKVEAVIYYIER